MTEKKNRAWRLFLFLWALLLLALGALGCCGLYRYLDVYERTRPEYVIEQFLAQTDADALVQHALAQTPAAPTAYEDAAELYRGYFSALDFSRPVTHCSDRIHSREDKPIYLIFLGANELCRVSLRAEGDSPGFSRQNWVIDEISAPALDELLPSVTLQLDVAADIRLFLNGRTLDQTPHSTVPIPGLNRFEAALAEPPAAMRYTLGPLYGALTLTDESGQTLTLKEASPGLLSFQNFGHTQALRLRAPAGLRIEINGIPLTIEDAVSVENTLETLKSYAPHAERRCAVYQFGGFYQTIAVAAFEDDGTPVTPVSSGGTLLFFHNDDAETEALLRPVAERFFTAFLAYSSGKYNAARYNELLPLLLRSSSLYRYISDSRDTMYWALDTSTEYRDISFSHFRLLSDKLAVCNVSYRQGSAEKPTEELPEIICELAFVLVGDRWLAASMDTVSGK